jgi:hypothetical protein
MDDPDRRRLLRTVAAYAALAAGWACLARWVLTPLVIAAAEGRGPAILKGLVLDPSSSSPVDRALERWRVASSAVLIAAGLHLTVVLFLRWWDRRPGGEGSRERRRVDLGLIVVSLAFFAVTILSGSRQDYAFHLQMWSEVRLGHDPWYLGVGNDPINAYGPLFNLLAVLTWINPLAPKLVFAWAYVLFAAWQTRDLADRHPGVLRLLGVFAWFWNPFAWVEIAHFGHFDILVALASLAAVRARARDRDILSGVCLGLGVLLKYIPIVLLPFLILDVGRFRFRLLLAALVTIGLGLGLSYEVWGTATFRPLAYAATRASTRLSIFKFLQGRYSPLQGVVYPVQIDSWSTLIQFLALLRAWSWCRLKGIDPAASAVLAVLTTLLFYRVGFPQYQMVLFVLISDWVIRDTGRLHGALPLVVAAGIYFGWLAFFDVLDCLISVGYNWIEDSVGLPTFVLGSVLVACVVRSANGMRRGLRSGESADPRGVDTPGEGGETPRLEG